MLEVISGDLTRERVDAIVNAANAYMEHGGGVAAAIVRRGGESIQKDSDSWVKLHGLVTHDKPACTTAGRLPCRYIIHAVGPMWGAGQEEAKLASAITGSLQLAQTLELHSIAFPAISTGIFGFPCHLAAKVIFKTFARFFVQHPETSLHLIRLVLYDIQTRKTFLDEFTIWKNQENA